MIGLSSCRLTPSLNSDFINLGMHLEIPDACHVAARTSGATPKNRSELSFGLEMSSRLIERRH